LRRHFFASALARRADFSLPALKGSEEGLLIPRFPLYLLQTIFIFSVCGRLSSQLHVHVPPEKETHCPQ
jgi:hypothetical protein